MQRLRFAFTAILFMAVACALNGQDFRAHIQGVVSDSSGASIPGAALTLSNVNTGIRVTASSNDAGAYRFGNVDPGTYTLTAERTGFTRFAQEKFVVQTAGDITIN